MQASFWIQGHSRRVTISDQKAVGVMVEIDARDERLNSSDPTAEVVVPFAILCLGKGEARAIASAIMGAAAEL